MSSKSYIQLGSGLLILNPIGGNLATNPTAVKPVTLQDIKIEIKGTIKELMGQYQFPDDTGTVDKKGTFEFSMGRKDYFLLNQVFNADTVVVGGTTVAYNEAHSVPGSVAYTVTITPPSSGTFVEDLSVYYATGAQLQKVASGSEAAGKYSVNASTGVYTFASADASASVLISYAYSLSAAGATYQVNNQVQGYGPSFEAFILDSYQSGGCTRLAQAKISDVSLNNKRADYAMVDLKGSFFASSTGRVMDLYSTNG